MIIPVLRRGTVLAAVFLLAVLFIPRHNHAQERSITVAFTSQTGGKLEGCDCPHDPYGGLAERVTLIRRLRKQKPSFMLLETGNMISIFGAYERKAADIMRLMNLMSYTATGVGPYELYNGTGTVDRMADTADFPLLSATIVDTRGEPLFHPFSITTVDGVSAAVVAVSDSMTGILHGGNQAYSFRIADPATVLKEVIREAGSRADFIILLSHLKLEHTEQLMDLFPSIDLAVQGYENRRLQDAVPAGGGFIVGPGSRGKFVGMATLTSSAGNTSLTRYKLLPVLGVPPDPEAQAIVREYTSFLSR